MRNSSGTLLLAGAIVLLSACNKPTPATADSATPSATTATFDEKANAAQIVAADSAFVRAITSKNVDSLMPYYDANAVSLGKTVVKGTSALRSQYDEAVKSPPRDVHFESNGVNFSDDHSMAWDYGTVSQTVDIKGKPVKTSGTYLNVWKNVGGRWMIVAEIGSVTP